MIAEIGSGGDGCRPGRCRPQPRLASTGLRYTEHVKAVIKLSGVRKVKAGIVLKNPVRITEDEADAIISQRRLVDKKRVPLDAVMRKLGYEIQR